MVLCGIYQRLGKDLFRLLTDTSSVLSFCNKGAPSASILLHLIFIAHDCNATSVKNEKANYSSNDSTWACLNLLHIKCKGVFVPHCQESKSIQSQQF